MASILRNGFFLISNGPIDPIGPTGSNGTSGTVPTVSFSGTSGVTGTINNIFGSNNSPLLVGFYPVVSNTLSSNPSISLCPGTNYLIRVVLPGETTVYWLSPPNVPFSSIDSSTQFTLSLNPNSGVRFSPVYTNTEINSFYNFPATLTVGSVIDNQSYQIQPRTDFSLAGYTTELPILLNNCSTCGCQTSRNCNTTTGVCQGIIEVCQPDAICGSINGSCPGTCAEANGRISTCQLVGNQYTCVPSQRNSYWAQLAWIILIAIFVIAFFYLAGMIIYRQYKPVQVIQPVEPIGQPNWRYQYVRDPASGCYKLATYPVQTIQPVTYYAQKVQPATSSVATIDPQVYSVQTVQPLVYSTY